MVETASTTVPGPLVVERVNAKLKALEYRAEHLQGRIRERPSTDKGRSYDINELQAIEASIVALKYHRAALDPETSPVLALAELLDACDASCDGPDGGVARLHSAQDRARKVLRDLNED